MEIYERIKEIRLHYFDDNNTKFAEFMGEKTTTTSGWTSGTGGKRGIGLNIIQKIVNKFPDINLNWLITGEGEMLKSTYNVAENTASTAVSKSIETYPAKQTRPRIPYTAAAGSLTTALEGVKPEQCEQIPRINAFPDYDFTIIIKGNSMEPKYEGGDEVACKRIDNTCFKIGRASCSERV